MIPERDVRADLRLGFDALDLSGLPPLPVDLAELGERLAESIARSVERALPAASSMADLARVVRDAERRLTNERFRGLFDGPFPGEFDWRGFRVLPTRLAPRGHITVLGGAGGVHLYNPDDEHIDLFLNPTPGWSRWTAGAREARRDRRRRERG